MENSEKYTMLRCWRCDDEELKLGKRLDLCKCCFGNLVTEELTESQEEELPHMLGGPPEKCSGCGKKKSCYGLSACKKHSTFKKLFIVRFGNDDGSFVITESTSKKGAVKKLMLKALKTTDDNFYASFMSFIADNIPERASLPEDMDQISQQTEVKKYREELFEAIPNLLKYVEEFKMNDVYDGRAFL